MHCVLSSKFNGKLIMNCNVNNNYAGHASGHACSNSRVDCPFNDKCQLNCNPLSYAWFNGNNSTK